MIIVSASILEILFLEQTNKLYQISYVILPTKLYVEISSFSPEELKFAFFMLLYNSISDIFQYLGGKILGRTKLFSFTEKTAEGYVCGLFLTPLVFFLLHLSNTPNHIAMCAFFNLCGMCGGLLSSLFKRKCNRKHWSMLLGPHGGVNDRLDCWMLPMFIACKLR